MTRLQLRQIAVVHHDHRTDGAGAVAGFGVGGKLQRLVAGAVIFHRGKVKKFIAPGGIGRPVGNGTVFFEGGIGQNKALFAHIRNGQFQLL